MISVSKTTRKQIKAFNEKTWHDVDIEHYGRPVDWREKKFLFKAEENGEIVGTITGKYESEVLYIDGLIVSRKHRKKGIGKALLEKHHFNRDFAVYEKFF